MCISVLSWLQGLLGADLAPGESRSSEVRVYADGAWHRVGCVKYESFCDSPSEDPGGASHGNP